MSRKYTEFAGHGFDLHPTGALFWQGERLLIVGDLHLEKASSYHASGQFLPPYDTAQTLDRLAAVIAEYTPDRLLFLGDVFHDGHAWERMSADNKTRFAALQRVCMRWHPFVYSRSHGLSYVDRTAGPPEVRNASE